MGSISKIVVVFKEPERLRPGISTCVLFLLRLDARRALMFSQLRPFDVEQTQSICGQNP